MRTTQQIIQSLDDKDLSRFSLMEDFGLISYFGEKRISKANAIRIMIEREQVRRQTQAVAS